MARMNEVEVVIRDAGQVLRIAIFQVPGTGGAHHGEYPRVLPQWIGLAPDVDAVADEIATVEGSVIETPFGRLTLFPHRSSPVCEITLLKRTILWSVATRRR